METTAAVTVHPSALTVALAEHDVRSRALGDGEFPHELERFSWGAFFFPWLWSIRRGVWWVLGIWVAQLLSGPALLMVLPSKTDSPVWLVFSMVTTVALAVFFLWLGVNGNRLAWKAAAKSNLRRMNMTVGKLIDGETVWIIFGVLLQVILLGLMVWAALSEPVAFYEAWTVAFEVLALALAVYLARKVGSPLWRGLSASI
ncbi:MAG: hypothetical protein U1E29_13350 [Coriobacteriia bacterium]|nr:hypothetical protein [Coriobacteriia bacterium]